jgi:hypothetical protein
LWSNTPSLQSKLETVTGRSCESCETDKFKPWAGFHKLQPDEPISGQGKQKLFIRGKFKWEAKREMVPEVARHGFTWDDFIFCTCHELMRDTEWHLFCLLGYGTRTEDEANNWLRERGVSLKVETDGDKLLKPKINHGGCGKKFYEPDPLDKSRLLWETACEYFEDPSMLAGTRRVWLSYANLNTVMRLPYPDEQQRSLFGPLSFDYFLAFTLRYYPSDVGHYLHQIFAHGPKKMATHQSLHLHSNENVERGNKEHKENQQNHCTHGGCGNDMCLDCTKHSLRKVTRHVRDATSEMGDDNMRIVTMPEYLSEIDAPRMLEIYHQ